MSEEDLWLRMKKLELQKKLLAMAARRSEEEKRVEAKPKDPYEIIKPLLEDRADEVLQAAKAQYPGITDAVVAELARLAEAGVLKKITGPWLMGLFTRLGYRPRLETKISIVSDGKTIDLKEKLSKVLKGEE